MKIRNIFIGILAVSCMAFSTACGQRDYDDFLTVEVNEIGLMKMVGIGDAIEIQNYDGIVCGRVSVR